MGTVALGQLKEKTDVVGEFRKPQYKITNTHTSFFQDIIGISKHFKCTIL